jgi:hypothetical protein
VLPLPILAGLETVRPRYHLPTVPLNMQGYLRLAFHQYQASYAQRLVYFAIESSTPAQTFVLTIGT